MRPETEALAAPEPHPYATISLNSMVARRVEAGAALLDRHHPGWHRRINLARLNARYPSDCPCGQTSRDHTIRSLRDNLYYMGVIEGSSEPEPDHKGFVYPYGDNERRQAARFGFDVLGYQEDSREEWELLTSHWLRVISQRLQKEVNDHVT